MPADEQLACQTHKCGGGADKRPQHVLSGHANGRRFCNMCVGCWNTILGMDGGCHCSGTSGRHLKILIPAWNTPLTFHW